MQGWLFKKDQDFWTADLSKALLTSVPLVILATTSIFTNNLIIFPKGRMLILDLQAELDPQYPRLDSFYGQPFIFCLLHNFGGTSGLNGAIPIISKVNCWKTIKLSLLFIFHVLITKARH